MSTFQVTVWDYRLFVMLDKVNIVISAEDLCELFHYTKKIPCIILRVSQFFPEEDDNRDRCDFFADTNLKANEFLHRRYTFCSKKKSSCL